MWSHPPQEIGPPIRFAFPPFMLYHRPGGGKIPTSPLGKYEFLLRCLVMCKLIRKLDRAGTTQPWTFKIPGEK